MAPGEQKEKARVSPIVRAIQEAERETTGEIRVHLSRAWLEPDPVKHAWRLFAEFGMRRTTRRNAVLIYLNLRRRRFAVVGDEGIHGIVGQSYWDELAKKLGEDLAATGKMEESVAIAVLTVGQTLKKYFPADGVAPNPNELSDEVSRD